MTWRIGLPTAAALLLSACGGSQPHAAENANTSEEETAEVTDCYKEAGEDFKQPKSQRALFVFVDQTTGLDDHLRDTVTENVKRLLKPGTSYAVYTFSAYSRGHYATPVVAGELAAPVTEEDRPDLSVRRLERLDRCLAREEKKIVSQMNDALEEATSASSSTFANSEILASLDQLAEPVRKSQARNKLVLVVSDLLEHSSTTSFYRNKQVRPIDAQAELQKAKQNGLVAELDGADVAVVGAGLLSPESGRDATRDTAALQSLRNFWEAWFEESGAEVVQYGQPDLVTPLQWDGSDSKS